LIFRRRLMMLRHAPPLSPLLADYASSFTLPPFTPFSPPPLLLTLRRR